MFTARLNNYMMRNNTHQVADFDFIVGNETSRQSLAEAKILPSDWELTDENCGNIIALGTKINVVSKVRGIWPACYVGAENLIEVAEDFLKVETICCREKIATILHEVGHAFFAFRKKTAEPSCDSGRNSYLRAMDQYFGNDRNMNALEEEFFADDFARFCGFAEALHAILRKLDQIAPERISRIEKNESFAPSFRC